MTSDTTSARIVVNGAPRESRAGTLADLVAELGLAHARVATAVNGAFVPQARRSATRLSEGDAVEIVSPRPGG